MSLNSALTIHVPSWFIIVSLMFFYLCIISGVLQFNGNFVDAQNNSKYPLKYYGFGGGARAHLPNSGW